MSAETPSSIISVRYRDHGFNPCRVFKSAATLLEALRRMEIVSFQSLSGFQVRCNFNSMAKGKKRYLFQSLSGFQVRCNDGETIQFFAETNVSIPVGFSSPLQRWHLREGALWSHSFNPCRVFKSAATVVVHFEDCDQVHVSIPVGFSSPLQQNDASATARFRSCVSIPVGFSSPLQQRDS